MPKPTRLDASETPRYAETVCPLCKGEGDWGVRCPNCNDKGTIPFTVAEEIVALIKRVKANPLHTTDDEFARNLATSIYLNYNVTRKG